MHTLLLRLDPTKDDVRMLEKAYYYIFQIHNSLVDYLKRQLRGMRRDKRYKNYIGRYHTLKKLVEKQPPDKKSPVL